MHILVIGGAGYIGSVTSEMLLAKNHEVTIVDNLSTGHARAVPEGAAFLQADIADPAALNQVFAGNQIDAVMHFAAKSIVPDSMLQPAPYFANNVGAVTTLLNAMTTHHVRRFVFSSSAAVYGSPKSTPITEDAPLRPESPYGTSKVIVEEMLPWYERANGLHYACLRYFNAAGASHNFGEDHSPETHLIPIALQTALGQRESLTIFGNDYPTPDGTAIRDYVHVLDLADAHIRAVEQIEDGSLVCNLGTEHGYSVAEVVKATQEITGVDLHVRQGGRRSGDPAVLVADATRASEMLHWRAVRGLNEIVSDAWRWHRQYPAGYEA